MDVSREEIIQDDKKSSDFKVDTVKRWKNLP